MHKIEKSHYFSEDLVASFGIPILISIPWNFISLIVLNVIGGVTGFYDISKDFMVYYSIFFSGIVPILFSVIQLIYTVYYNRYVEYLNGIAFGSVEPPHELIDNFLKWEIGDKIKVRKFKGYFRGVNDDFSVVLERDEGKAPKIYVDGTKSSREPKYFELSPRLFQKEDFRNYDLEKRIRDNREEWIEKNIKSESSYNEFLNEFKNQYDEIIDNEQELINQTNRIKV